MNEDLTCNEETLRDAGSSPQIPRVLAGAFELTEDVAATSASDPAIQELFPQTYGGHNVHISQYSGDEAVAVGQRLRIGVVFSGGPASGGHNVITGLFDFLQGRNQRSEVIGFLGGPSGLVDGTYKVVTEQELKPFRNQGGFHFLGTGRTKIETDEQKAKSVATCQKLELDGLIIIGGDDSNTNAAILAEYFKENGCSTSVIGVPKTIDGDLRCEHIEASFGFDTAAKSFSNLVASISFDAVSSLKQWHLCRLMGRDASHLTLEVALSTHPNLAFISEAAKAEKLTLKNAVAQIADIVIKRSKLGKNYGVVLIPEGFILNLNDMSSLIAELNDILAGANHETTEEIDPLTYAEQLTEASAQLFKSLPAYFRKQLTGERDPHGNVTVSQIEMERLMGHMVADLIHQEDAKVPFNWIPHFFGYEGRCSPPSAFDAAYCFNLGATAGALIEKRKTGLLVAIQQLSARVDQWKLGAVPTTSLMQLERRHGKMKPVIKKHLVQLDGKPYLTFKEQSPSWMVEDHYQIQRHVSDEMPMTPHLSHTLMLEEQERREKGVNQPPVTPSGADLKRARLDVGKGLENGSTPQQPTVSS